MKKRDGRKSAETGPVVDEQAAVERVMALMPVRGTSGHEREVAEWIRQRLLEAGARPEQISMDQVNRRSPLLDGGGDCGNLVFRLRGTVRAPRRMLCAHMDTAGVIVTDVDERGFLRFSAVGEIEAALIPGRHVRFCNGARGVTFFETADKTAAKAAAASLEPPPSPAAAGIRLTNNNSAPRSIPARRRTNSTARCTRFSRPSVTSDSPLLFGPPSPKTSRHFKLTASPGMSRK